MAGQGFYNEHSLHQRNVAAAGTAMLRRAASSVGNELASGLGSGSSDPPAGQLVLVDYGSSQGANSVEPVRTAIDAFRDTEGHGSWPVTVVHLDLPENDWTSLFELVGDPASSYRRGEDDVFTLAAGVSFFEQALPAGSVGLGWCSMAAHWVVDRGCSLETHVLPALARGSDRECWSVAANDGWRQFLVHRQSELRRGGQLVVNVPVASPRYLPFFELFEGCVRAAHDEGVVAPEEFTSIVVPIFHQTADELLRPIRRNESELDVVETEAQVVADPSYAVYARDGDRESFADRATATARAWSEACFAQALSPARSEGDRRDVLDALYSRLHRRLAADPEAGRFDWEMLLLRLRRR